MRWRPAPNSPPIRDASSNRTTAVMPSGITTSPPASRSSFTSMRPCGVGTRPSRCIRVAEMRRDFRARVARRRRSHAENPGCQIVGRRRRPCVTSASRAVARAPIFLEGAVAALYLRPPFHASRGNQIAPPRADDRVVHDVRKKWLRRDDVVLDVELHVLGRIHSLLEVRGHVVGNRRRDDDARFVEDVVEHAGPALARRASGDDRDRIRLLAHSAARALAIGGVHVNARGLVPQQLERAPRPFSAGTCVGSSTRIRHDRHRPATRSRRAPRRRARRARRLLPIARSSPSR